MTSETNASQSRDALKQRAKELGIEYPANIPTPKLEALIASHQPVEAVPVDESEYVEGVEPVAVDKESLPADVLVNGRAVDWVSHHEASDRYLILFGDPSREQIHDALNADTVTIRGRSYKHFSGIVHSPARKGVTARIAFNARFGFDDDRE